MERSEIKKELDRVADNLTPIAKEQLETEGHFDPVVVLVYPDDRKEFLYPRYQNEAQRREAFEKVNKHIRDTEALGVVLMMETWFFPKDSTGPPKDSLLLMKRAWGINEYEAWTYQLNDEEVEWGNHIGPEPKTSDMLITAFKEMH